MTAHHVYADANIFLDFFRFSDDDLGELEKLATHIDSKNITLYLPQLTAEEYFRNRDKIVLEQLQDLKNVKLKVGIPTFIRESQSAKDFLEKLSDALAMRNALLEEVEAQAVARNFRADDLIGQIFSKANRIPTTPALLQSAGERVSLGNPPGKPGSIGDRLNWESLIQEVPEGNDIYLITRDNDYISTFSSASPNMFLCEEWAARKSASVRLFKGIKSFAKIIDESLKFNKPDEPVFEKDPARTEKIMALVGSYNYASTHYAVAELANHIDKMSPDELEYILQGAMDNSQIGGIMGDDDVETFYKKIRNKMPWVGNTVADKFDEVFGDFSDIPF